MGGGKTKQISGKKAEMQENYSLGTRGRSPLGI